MEIKSFIVQQAFWDGYQLWEPATDGDPDVIVTGPYTAGFALREVEPAKKAKVVESDEPDPKDWPTLDEPPKRGPGRPRKDDA